MKRITIGEKEYTIEFSIEATLYNECTESVMAFFIAPQAIESQVENDQEANEATRFENGIKRTISEMADVPQKALTLFYAGLLEHHGSESGDGSVNSIKEAKRLLVTYMRENESINLYDVLTDMINEMGNDNFFEKSGLSTIMENMNAEVNKQTKKMKQPQDHKKKATKVGDN